MYNHEMFSSIKLCLETVSAVRVSGGSGSDCFQWGLGQDFEDAHSANDQNSALRCIAHYLATRYNKEQKYT